MEYNGLEREQADIELLNKQNVIHQNGQPERIFAVKTITKLLKWKCGNR